MTTPERPERAKDLPAEERPGKHASPRPGSTISTGGHIQETRSDHVNPEIAGGPDHGGRA